MQITRLLCTLLVFTALGCIALERAPRPSDYLYVWSGDADEQDADFLAVFDVRPGSSRYGQIVRTVAVEGRGNWPHHTEYEAAAGGTLFANGWGTGRTFVFDLSRPDSPRVSATFTGVGGYAYPHSYARLPNGNVLATFQSVEGRYAPPGGLVEMNENGEVVRSVVGRAPGIPDEDTWPYSLLVVPELDRVITTNTRMGLVSEWTGRLSQEEIHAHVGHDSRPTHVQIWRLSDLELLATLKLPTQEGGHNEHVAEPRRLANGEVYVNTFTCGLYHIADVGGSEPRIEPVLSSRFDGGGWCAVPVVVGNYWVQPSATDQAVVAYDLSGAEPRQVSRVAFESPFSGPHWLALDPSQTRIVVTADHPEPWVMLFDIDRVTGRLSVDERFRDSGADRPGVNFDRTDWPHGATGKAMPHGAVFSVHSPPL